MEDISRQIHPSEEWDFHLASKLYSSLHRWKDSYHMLLALDARDGEAYDAVKKVAVRHEKVQSVRFEKYEPTERRKPFKKRIVPEKVTTTRNEERTEKCYVCGKSDHFSRTCPQRVNPNRNSSHGWGIGSDRTSENKPQTSRALSTFVEDWCGMLGTPCTAAMRNRVTVGKPTLCNAVIFGIKVKALVDTGSVISIVPASLLKQAKDQGFDIDKELTW